MRYETIHNLQIPKIGFGTWTIGGRGSADPSLDEKSLLALRSALELGYTHFDTAENYAAGHSEELVGRAIREMGVPRESLFITSKVEPNHLQYEQVLRCCADSLRRLRMEYLDLYLIHWPTIGMNLPETFRALNQLVREGRVRHLGVSNFNLKLLKQAAALSETPLLTNQVPYSIPDREYVKKGVLEYCQQNDILLTAYTPVKHRFTQGNHALKELAQARGVTPAQISLAWLTTQPRVITIPMSFNPQHQAENLAAADVVLSAEEMERLNRMFA
ncbi:MAG TPA: aldo/keto reductase [Anaerolinea sp.]|nr:aldo/keto reductase [Anaerolinea sp.]